MQHSLLQNYVYNHIVSLHFLLACLVYNKCNFTFKDTGNDLYLLCQMSGKCGGLGWTTNWQVGYR